MCEMRRSHEYFRTLTAQATPLRMSGTCSVRVKLVFLDEIAAFVHRQRGFSSCWYMVPRTAKLVGDLIHDVAHEFELLERCAGGIELLMDGCNVMANQDIDLIRDNDMLAVQCASAYVEHVSKRLKNKRSNIEMDENKGAKKAKKGKAGMETTSSIKNIPMKTNAAKSSESKGGSNSLLTVKEKTKPIKRPVAESSSSSDSSSSSSESSSDDDEKPSVSVPLTKTAFKSIIKETVKDMNKEVFVESDSSSSDSSSGSSSSDDESEVPTILKKVPSAQQPKNSTGKVQKKTEDATSRTRRRRRPRRRPKADTASTPAHAKKSTTESRPLALDAPPQSKEIRPLRIRGIRPAPKQVVKNHFRFDGGHKEPSQHEVAITTDVSVPSDLQKYGPGARMPSQTKSSSQGRHQQEPQHDGDELPKKKTQKEMWKRPYEIVASILDETSTAAANTKPTLDDLLAQYPSKPSDTLPSGCAVQASDIIAYKTLTLCLETWQPIVSGWQCGKVLTIEPESDNTIELQPYKWILPSDCTTKLAQAEADDDTPIQFTLGEISELRYIDGPTKTQLDTTTA